MNRDYEKMKLTYKLSSLIDLYSDLVNIDRPMTKREVEQLLFERITDMNNKLNERSK